ncbi:MAG TPA: hypothetical protein PKL73_15465 [Polyangiaceae bacterium]|nr:MAG: hypothetical protein BWY17_03769 [Deltaproteobacteria bacterium ADurb.Bin207]HNS98349.1 hypothetical protein [Polyangiaceae bacterium]HNZ23674.1 hypothetical protein [Polyangiaceae bacterium]HOD22411.1 hypothetical protein [Polyangiaceae bacterium]HOE47819.1 hypothetical protein [Polyangiaceae bacterium]
MQDESFDSRDDASLPVPVQVGLAAMRARGPSPEAVERLRAGLGLAGPSGPEQPPEPSPPHPASSPVEPPPAPTILSLPILKSASAVLLAAVVGGLLWFATRPPSPAAVFPSGSSATSAPSLPTLAASSSPQIVQPPVSSASVLDEPKIVRPAESKPASAVPSELDLIQQAQRALHSHPQRTLSLCREHARRYPHGMLAQEREVLMVEALQRLGHDEEAKDRSRAFLKDNPDSAHRKKIEHVTGQPSSSSSAPAHRPSDAPKSKRHE